MGLEEGAEEIGKFMATTQMWAALIFGVVFLFSAITLLGVYIYAKTSSMCKIEKETKKETDRKFKCRSSLVGILTIICFAVTLICGGSYAWNKYLLKNKTMLKVEGALTGAAVVGGFAGDLVSGLS
jgi:Mn2+/Fe2+ NRAMP family transporter